MAALEPRHTSPHSMDSDRTNASLEYHWGYFTRALPCLQDEKTCAYLDICYDGHDFSMLVTFVLWAVILGLSLTFLFLRAWKLSSPGGTLLDTILHYLSTLKRKHLLSDTPFRRLFPHTSRLQLLILTLLLTYLLIFSLIGITYKTWAHIPTPNTSYTKTRTSLGPWSDRIGALAYALTPLTILLSNRESVLSVVTGIPYQHFTFLHRWLGRVIYIQAVLHTLAWTIIEGNLYGPQPETYRVFVSQFYAIWGVVAMALLTLLVVLSSSWAIRRWGYEFFKVGHWVLAVAYVGACIGHWEQLWCWMVASFGLISLDVVIRGVRIVGAHFRLMGEDFGYKPAQATVTRFGEDTKDEDGVVLRIEFKHRASWKPGQHFFLTFPSVSIWQAHPFTPSSLPTGAAIQQHIYLVRVRGGITSSLAKTEQNCTLPVLMTGPYGDLYPQFGWQNCDLLLIAGGTGVTFTLPIFQELLRRRTTLSRTKYSLPAAELVWIVRYTRDILWLEDEIRDLKTTLAKSKTAVLGKVRIFVSREGSPSHDPTSAGPVETSQISEKNPTEIKTSPSPTDLHSLMLPASNFEVIFLRDHHPDLQDLVQNLSNSLSASKYTQLEFLGSGPPAMDSSFRKAVSGLKTGKRGKVEVGCYFDSRA